jgi:hypothetical protein
MEGNLHWFFLLFVYIHFAVGEPLFSRSERPSTAKSQRYKAPDTLDMSPVLDRPISPTSERRTSQNGLFKRGEYFCLKRSLE